ncbi:hypothetical protein [Nocardioides jensenii]|uniref:hypothetical protein n=1 Tax=Nocardioides jensenii TaxID=1843 RepID=UPI00082F3A06|nr:hypothetical protein [Nocardioides jensenii]
MTVTFVLVLAVCLLLALLTIAVGGDQNLAATNRRLAAENEHLRRRLVHPSTRPIDGGTA